MDKASAERIPDDRKLKELILFICQRSLTDPRFGATKLNKLLFFAEFAAFRKLGQAITWHEYQKLEWGPAPRHVIPMLRELEQAGDLVQAKHDYFGRKQKRSVALRDADISSFTQHEIAIVTELIEEFWDRNATEMSLLSHEFEGWKLAEVGESIPYEVAFLKPVGITPADRQFDEVLRADLRSLKESA